MDELEMPFSFNVVNPWNGKTDEVMFDINKNITDKNKVSRLLKKKKKSREEMSWELIVKFLLRLSRLFHSATICFQAYRDI